MYEGQAKSFEPEHIRLQFCTQSIHQWNMHFYWLLWVCCGYDVIV